jgi:Raf kinase inhibitor-like YbhB/YbcL family protein
VLNTKRFLTTVLFCLILHAGASEPLTLSDHSDDIWAVAFSPDGRLLASGGPPTGAKIRIWDATNGALIRRLAPHRDDVSALAFSPDGKWLASGSVDKTVRIWKAETGELVHNLMGHAHMVRSVAFSHGGESLVSGSDGDLKLWDPITGTECKTLHEGGSAAPVAFRSDGKVVALVGIRPEQGKPFKTVRIWDTQSGEVLPLPEGIRISGWSAAFAPSAQLVAGVSHDNRSLIKVWEVDSGVERRTFPSEGDVGGFAFSAEGDRLAAGRQDGKVRVWDLGTGELLHLFTEHTRLVRALAFSSDGKRLATGSDDDTIKIWALDERGKSLERMKLTSSAFQEGEGIPVKHTGEGTDVSPPLSWDGVPKGTKELVLICDDPDAPRPTPWVHWVLYGIAPDRASLPEEDSGEGIEGRNDFGRTGYGGPMPPRRHGTHHYHFKLYALDRTLGLKPGATKEQVLAAMEGHVLAEAELIGTYERK